MFITRPTAAEFEFDGSAPPEPTAAALIVAGICAMHRDGYTHTPPDPGFDVCVELDPAGRRARNALEVKTRWLSTNDWLAGGVVDRLLDVLRRQDAKIDHRAALHVRVEAPDLVSDWERLRSLTHLVYHYEHVIFGLVHTEAKRMGSWLMPSLTRINACRTAANFKAYLEGSSRWLGMNVRGLLSSERPHVEFRWRQSTLDHGDAVLWTALMCRLVDHAVHNDCPALPRIHNDREALDSFIQALGLPDPEGRVLRSMYRVDPPPPRPPAYQKPRSQAPQPQNAKPASDTGASPPRPIREHTPRPGATPPQPGKTRQTLNVIRHAGHAARSVAKTTLGIDRASEAQVEARLNVCRQCPGGHAVWTPGGPRGGDVHTCGPMLQSMRDAGEGTCGCILHKKARDRAEDCPFGWWSK